MKNKSVYFMLVGITLACNAHVLFADSQQLITTDSSKCSSSEAITESIPGGTSQEVITSSIPDWEELGFTVGSVSPDKTILVCTSKSEEGSNRGGTNINVVETPEQEGLDQASSVSTLAIGASIIQTNNLYTRLAALRIPTYSALTEDEESGDGASADSYSIFDEKLNIFVNMDGSFGDQDVTQRSNGFDFNTIGTTIGVDYRLTDNFAFGTAFGYTSGHTEMNKGLGDADIDTYSLSLYGGYSLPNSFYFEGLFKVGWNNYDARRNFSSSLDPNVIEQGTSDYKGNDYSVSLATGYDYTLDAFSFSPFLRYDYIHVDIDEYQENATTLVNTVEAQHIDSMRTALGAWFSYVVKTPYAVVIPAMRAEWQHEFMNDSRLLTSYQNNTPSNISQLLTDSPDRDFANLSFGFSAVFPHGVSAFFFYETMLANSLTTLHSFNGGVQIQF